MSKICKAVLSSLFAAAVVSSAVFFGPGAASAGPKIGLLTATVSQSEEEYRAAEEVVAKYGKENVEHLTYPDKFMDEQETTISQILVLASDPDIKGIVICQAVPGTSAGIQKARELRDDLVFIGGNLHEEPYMAAQYADFLFEIDQISRGETILAAAKNMGANTFVHYSFPRHMGMPLLAKRRDIMQEASAGIGLKFVHVNAPDPTGESGIAGTQQFMLEDVPRQVEKYGPDTALFGSNCAMQEPLIKSIVKTKAILAEQCCPSPYHALPSALGISIPSDKAGNIPYILEAIAKKVGENGMNGRIATWNSPVGMSFVRAGAAYAWAYANGETTEKRDIDLMKKFLRETAGDVKIRAYDDEKAPNILLVVGETLYFGR